LESKKLERSIGLIGSAATLVGYVVGASIFILPGELAPSTGPALFIAFLIAAVPALFSCFVTAQIGCAYPESGAPYVAASRNLSPFWGFMLVWSLLTGATIGIPLIAYSFADYLAFFVADLSPKPVALATVVFFAGINWFGARISVKAQGVMVLAFVAALLVFGLGGLPHVELANFQPMFPNGFGPVLGAAIPAYFSFVGFSMIADLAGEVDRPGWTIPRALALSFLCVIFLYTLVPLTLVGIVPWTELGAMKATVAEAARLFTPELVASLISIGALFAAATSLNGILFAISRDVYALAEDRIFPQQLGELSGRRNIPRAAILTVAGVGFIGTAVGATITRYAVAAVMAIMLLQILSAAAVFVLPKRSPKRYERAAFRLSPLWRITFSVGLILVSLLFMGLGVAQDGAAARIFVVLILLGAAYYGVRKMMLQRQGLQIEDVLRKDRALAAAE
jgi:amino acid transporter